MFYINRCFLLFIFVFFLSACQSSTHNLKNIEPPSKSIVKVTPYSSLLKEFDQIKKPEPIKPRFVNTTDDYNFTLVDIDNATHVLLDANEYYKIKELVDLTKKYKLIILKYDDLLNKQNEQLLAFRQLVDKENNKASQYYNLLQTNIALLENCEEEVSSAKKTTIFTTIGLGGVILLLVAL